MRNGENKLFNLNEARKILITGCAGFIGSNLTDYLLKQGHQVLGIDNLNTGKIDNLKVALKNSNFKFYNLDLFENKNLTELFYGKDIVYHLSANADVRYGGDSPSKDLNQNTIVTHNVLEAARIAGIPKFVFSSTGSIYGESGEIPTPENTALPIQTSLYGASKLASEGFIQAYSETFGFQVWIFRFVSILGPRYSHGHVYDFYTQLRNNPHKLKVLGNGMQTKSYLHVEDCLEGINVGIQKSDDQINVFNLGFDGTCTVRDSIKWITETLGVNPQLDFGAQDRGWIGDNPLIYLSTSKIRSLGWRPRYTIKESIIDTVQYLQKDSPLQL